MTVLKLEPREQMGKYAAFNMRRQGFVPGVVYGKDMENIHVRIPFREFERMLQTYIAYAPRGFKSFSMALPLWLKSKLWMKSHIREQLGFEGQILFPEHHEAHAASAFYPSPFGRAAILTMDGVGEWATASIGTGVGNTVALSRELRFPHSLGLLYCAFTYYTGFKVNSGEYKVMGLAPYGEPKYADLIYKELIDLKEDGSFKLNQEYFDYCAGLAMTGEKFHKLFGGPPRQPESELTQKEMDLAASVQAVTEEVMLRMARHARKDGVAGRVVTLKLRTTDFKIHTRRRTIALPTQTAKTLFAVGREMLAREADGRPFRLIGIGMAELVAADAVEGDFFAGEERRALASEKTLDTLRARFGAGAVTSGRILRAKAALKED